MRLIVSDKITVLVIVLLLAVSAGCEPGLRNERQPYRFSYGMIDQPNPLGSRRGIPPKTHQRRHKPRRATSKHTRATVLHRTKALIGSELAATQSEAQQRFISLALGKHDSPCANKALAPSLPQGSGDIICFRKPAQKATDTGNPATSELAIAIVLKKERDQIEFAFVSGTHARHGIMTPSAPTKRRTQHAIINSYVALRRPSDKPRSAYLATEAYAGHVPFEQIWNQNRN